MVKRIRVGIAAMAKKATSKPMKEIVRRFEPSIFEFVYFGDDLLLNEPIENWPQVDYLIAFASGGYPLDKVIEYVALRKPITINDVAMQRELLDRRSVYRILAKHNISTPRHIILDESERADNVVVENDDWIEIKGVRITKPVVEKPVDAEDHNIYIYYPMSAGGGSKRLFRKVGDKSSQFYPEVNELRKEGSYIYEEFIETQGVDVKVYTVGPNYGHAEARKSPVIDGKVNRNQDGSETRYPVILSQEEKMFANKVCIAFKQGVCGFDILRVNGKSYVCDVNGWSFVKTSTKYFDDCAQLLSEIIWTSVRHKGWGKFSAVAPLTITHRDTANQHHPHGVSPPQHGGASGGMGLGRSPTKFNHLSVSNRLLTRDSFKGNVNDMTIDEDATNEIDAEVEAAASQFSRHVHLKHYSNYPNGAVGGGSYSSSNINPDYVPFQRKDPLPTSDENNAEGDDKEVSGAEAADGNGSKISGRGLTPQASVIEDDDESSEELRCVIAIIRHGDRTPKQKLKFVLDLYDQSLDISSDDEHQTLGISSTFLPFFTFFHAFLDADYQAAQAESSRKQTGCNSTSAVKGGLAAALGSTDEMNQTISSGSTAAAVALVQTEVLSAPPSWPESLLKSFHKLLTNPNKEDKSSSSIKSGKRSPSPRRSSPLSSSSSLFSYRGRKNSDSNGSIADGATEGSSPVMIPPAAASTASFYGNGGGASDSFDSVNLRINADETIARSDFDGLVIDDIDIEDIKQGGGGVNDNGMGGDEDELMGPDGTCAQKAAAELARSAMVDRERADANGSLTRAEGAELLRAARIHLENSAAAGQQHTGETTVASKHSNDLIKTLAAKSDALTADEQASGGSDLMSMFDPPSPPPSTSNETAAASTSATGDALGPPTPPAPLCAVDGAMDGPIPSPLTPTRRGNSMTSLERGNDTPVSKHDQEDVSNKKQDGEDGDETLSSMMSALTPSSSDYLANNPPSPLSPQADGVAAESAESEPQSEEKGKKRSLKLNIPESVTPPSIVSPTSDKSGKSEKLKDKSKSTKERDAPLKRDVKVKSKEGLKSFLATSERVKEMLIQHLAANDDSKSASECDELPSSKEDEAKKLLRNLSSAKSSDALMYKLQQITDVLGHGEINGVTRKLQIKGLEWAPIYDNDDDDDSITSGDDETSGNRGGSRVRTRSGSGGSINDKGEDTQNQPYKLFGAARSKSTKSAKGKNSNKYGLKFRATKIEIILKWGGALTPLGEAQAQYLGESLRKSLYPDPLGGGVLRLHATFRHDLKIRTSDEGRVMKTAASFAKGLLQLEGSLTPILVSLVRKDKGSLQMLDHAGDDDVNANLGACKRKMNEELQKDDVLDMPTINSITAVGQKSMIRALGKLVNPRKRLIEIHRCLGEYVKQIESLIEEVKKEAIETPTLYMDETPFLMLDRWKKLYNDFYSMKKKDKKNKDKSKETSDDSSKKDKKEKKVKEDKDPSVPVDYTVGVFDLSKVPDVLDAIRYDLEHNFKRLDISNDVMSALYQRIKTFADAYVSQEYGIDRREKYVIGSKVCAHLLRKIRDDLILGTEGNDAEGSNPDMQYMLDTSHAEYLDVKSLGRHVRTRLYFTSESHLHTLLNVLRYGHLQFPGFPESSSVLKKVMDDEGEESINNVNELCYLTHIVIRVFENLSMPKDNGARFRVELSFSPGASRDPFSLNASGNGGGRSGQRTQSTDSSSSTDTMDAAIGGEGESQLNEEAPQVGDYFENNPKDVVSHAKLLRVAPIMPLNRSLTLSASELETFLEKAIDVAKSGTSANN